MTQNEKKPLHRTDTMHHGREQCNTAAYIAPLYRYVAPYTEQSLHSEACCVNSACVGSAEATVTQSSGQSRQLFQTERDLVGRVVEVRRDAQASRAGGDHDAPLVEPLDQIVRGAAGGNGGDDSRGLPPQA
jgi:hypothetical protein